MQPMITATGHRLKKFSAAGTRGRLSLLPLLLLLIDAVMPYPLPAWESLIGSRWSKIHEMKVGPFITDQANNTFASEGGSPSKRRNDQFSTPGAVESLSKGRIMREVFIAVTDGSMSSLEGTVIPDNSDDCSSSIPTTRDYTLLPWKPGYGNPLTLDELELSAPPPNRTIGTRKACLQYEPDTTKPVLSWRTGVGKSYLIPALEIPAFVLLLNGYARLVYGDETYGTNLSTFWDHVVHGPWVIDQDSFQINQLRHPYQGSIYHGIARSTGLDFWESLGYTFAGSFLWETAGETTPPSINDQIASGVAGSFLGEPLFRMASLLLEGGGRNPGFWRELGAAVLSPPTGFNRLAFGDRFKAVFPSHNPAIFQRLRLGAMTNVQLSDSGGGNVQQNEAAFDYFIVYGLPGNPDYGYKRPFNYFEFEFSVASGTEYLFENVTTRGLLVGKEYEVGGNYQGVGGLYGSFDYLAPQIFRYSSTAFSGGTTAQWRLSSQMVLQGTVLGGIGYGAAGTIGGSDQSNYHYGITGQGLLALRLIFGRSAMLDISGREYYISGLGSRNPGESDIIGRLNVGLTVRFYGNHALAIQYVGSSRLAYYPDRNDIHQTIGTLGLFYTLLGDTRFGAVEERHTNPP
jgi:hypothetical protein